jgi:four helix bundle protein
MAKAGEGCMSLGSYKDLRVWQQAVKLALDVYKTTSQFPKHELYGLANQLRRAAVSVPSNIAEGKGHRSDAEFVRFLFHARGSLLEVETQICLATQLQYMSQAQSDSLMEQTSSVACGLNALIKSLESVGARSRRPTTND